jgi:hypothetical protein
MEVLDYNQETGVLRWNVNKSSTAMKGSIAGCNHKNKNGREYIHIRIDGKQYLGHRIAYLYVHGYMPKEVDHKDNNGLHNWIDNLREATHAQNNWNKDKKSNNNSGYKGVSMYRRNWRAEIQVNKVRYCKKGFETPELAYQWYCEKSRELHREFSRV